MLPDMNLRASGGDESQRIGDDGVNNKPSCEYVDNSAINNHELKRKRYHRHTPQQIQEMEAHLLRISILYPSLRTCGEHRKNSNFRTENDELRAQNMMYKEAFTNPCCRAVVARISSNEHHLRVENARLRNQPLVDDATIPSSTASPTTDIEVVRRIKEKHKIEE
ncbi:UNVERIFIED_CONTAM: Homeobox-leucine zipper protein ROC5 [Sesamum calycinum]|uniref:Homeobox-leucine zipper protein ROC5 n=1 Tax=Sesamum calycinum TaxID=2727403 RepID=A0AAW2Q3L7_9LAMI